MAIESAIIRPTAHIKHSSSSADIDNMENLYDNDLSTYSKFSSTTSVGVLTKFDTSLISPSIKKIISIKFCLDYVPGSGTKPRAKPVYKATSTTSFTGIGANSNIDVNKLLSGNVYYADFSEGVTFWNARLTEFMNGGFEVRLYSGNKGDTLYEAYAIVEYEYEAPKITITTQVSPSEGGTISAGGIIDLGTSIPFTATPNEGYEFSHWLFNGVPAYWENPLVGYCCSQDTVITAVFKKIGNQSSVFCGTKRVQVYCGTKKVSVYCGTKKLT